MSDDKSPKQAQDRRDVDLSESRRGIIVMPMVAAPVIDITNQAPTGVPAPQQTKPGSGTPPTADK
ncbi:MAG: hypothetical protein ACRDLN_04450 [Solirubrobacteraceae bacterium]